MAAIQPAILESLGRLELLPWISVGFAVGSAPILPWGKCFGIFSVKKLFLLQILIFEIGSAICGAAPNMTALVIGRVIAGLGGSGMYSGALSYIAMLTTEVERSRYVAGVSAVWGLGSVLGPVVSAPRSLATICAGLRSGSNEDADQSRSGVVLLRAVPPGGGRSTLTSSLAASSLRPISSSSPKFASSRAKH